MSNYESASDSRLFHSKECKNFKFISFWSKKITDLVFKLKKCDLSSDKDQSFAKPSPRGILSILKRLNFDKNKSNAIMIGGSIVDVLAAKRVNIHACLLRRNMNKYTDDYEDWEYSPDFVVDKLDEIIELVQRK